MITWPGKTVWITGASSGIGAALAVELAGRGASLILSGRRLEALQAVAERCGGETLVLPFEATDYAALPQAVERAWHWRGSVDCLVNNAGVSQRSLILDTDVDVYRQLMEINFFAPVALTQALLPRLIERRSGNIAIVSSVAGKIGTPLRAGYCAAKHACCGYFEAARAELELAYGIGVSVILPGSVRTGIAMNALGADGRSRGKSDPNIDAGIDPADAARTIADGLANGDREIVVARGMEEQALKVRAQQPEMVFAMTAQEGERLARLRAAGGPDASPDPAFVNQSRRDQA
jgi:short-subunit dehydrogenase